MNTSTAYIELDGTEFEIDFEWSYHHCPAKLSGPWEDSYPEEEEFEWYVHEDHMKYSAMEWWELNELIDDEHFFYKIAMENMEDY